MARLKFRRRVPYVPQMEAAECGVACLSMILRYFGAEHPLSSLRAMCEVGRDGVSAAKLYRAAERFGLTVEALRVEPEQLATVTLPAIAHWEFNHFVVVVSVDASGAQLVDPALGERRVTLAELSRALTGVVLTFGTQPTFAPRRARSASLVRLAGSLRGLRSSAAALLLAAALLEGFSLLLPAASQVLIDHVLVPHRERWLAPLLGSLFACSLATLVTLSLRDRVLRRLHFAADLELAVHFAERLLRLPLGFFMLRSSGDLMQRVEAQRAIRDVAQRLLSGALDGFLLLGYATMMLAYDARVGAAIVALSLLRSALVWWARKPVAHAAAAELAAHGREAQVVVETLGAPELVRASRAEPVLQERHEERFVERLNAELGQRTVGERAVQLSAACDGIAQALVLALGGSAVLADRMTLGVFAGLFTLQGVFQKPLRALIDSITSIDRARATLARLDDVFDEAAEPQGQLEVPVLSGRLQLEGVSFRHPGHARAVCERVNLTIEPGEKVALVGRSGQGKSTLLSLLSGLLQPTEGRVLFDGHDLRSLTREALARHLGVVLQDPFLLDDSVHGNLTLGVPTASPRDVQQACAAACIEQRIAVFADGYDAQLGDNAARLSGGERQRMALARALVRRPRVLLLDEATSSLDLETEARVHQQLAALRCTRVVVAHRLQTVRDADRILVIDEGRIVQEGSFDALSMVPGPFRELVEHAASAA